MKHMKLVKKYRMTAFRPMDDEHRVFQCGNCGKFWEFEADGPFENGWDYCPACGLHINDSPEES